MLAQLRTRRRAVAVAYRRYIEADAAWAHSTENASRWFPTPRQAHLAIIGNPGSNVRRLYRQRERAMLQLETARIKLKVAKSRLSQQRNKARTPTLLIGVARL